MHRTRGPTGEAIGHRYQRADDQRRRPVRAATGATASGGVGWQGRRDACRWRSRRRCPAPISTSPMLNTFANGSQAGKAKMSVSGARAGSSRTALLEKPVERIEAGGRQGLRRRRHHPAVGHDRREIGDRSERDQRHPGDRAVAPDRDEHEPGRGDVDRPRRPRPERAADRGREQERSARPARRRPATPIRTGSPTGDRAVHPSGSPGRARSGRRGG